MADIRCSRVFEVRTKLVGRVGHVNHLYASNRQELELEGLTFRIRCLLHLNREMSGTGVCWKLDDTNTNQGSVGRLIDGSVVSAFKEQNPSCRAGRQDAAWPTS